MTALVAIGYQVIGKLPTGQAALAASMVWLVGALPVLFGALQQG